MNIKKCLVARVTVADVEASSDPEGHPFDPAWPDWVSFKSQLDHSVELWHFKSPEDAWTGTPRCGIEGYAAVRAGEVQDWLLLRIS